MCIRDSVSTVVVQKGVERIEEWAFGDSNIKDIHLPDYIPEMSPSMFETEEGVKGLRIHCLSLIHIWPTVQAAAIQQAKEGFKCLSLKN